MNNQISPQDIENYDPKTFGLKISKLIFMDLDYSQRAGISNIAIFSILYILDQIFSIPMDSRLSSFVSLLLICTSYSIWIYLGKMAKKKTKEVVISNLTLDLSKKVQ